MSSCDYVSTWPEVDIEVGTTRGDVDAGASESEARLRIRLLRATAVNAGLSAAALICAAIYMGGLAHRLLGSRPVETPHAWSTWTTAFLLVLYGVAAWLLSVGVRRTTRKLLRIHQVSERQRHEAYQREQAKLVEAASAARIAEIAATERQQLFMAKVGHEIRTPAQIIVSDAEFLEHRLAENPELHLTLRRLRSAADLMSHQMQSIAAFARSQSLRSEARVQRVMLHAAISDIVETAKSLRRAYSKFPRRTLRIPTLRLVAQVVGRMRAVCGWPSRREWQALSAVDRWPSARLLLSPRSCCAA